MENQMQELGHWEICGGKLTIYGTAEKPLFMAKEVVEKLGHTDVSMMVQLVGDSEKLTRKLFWAGKTREMYFLTENGLYEILMQSRKPIAKRFKTKVKEILRELRTKGTYTVEKPQEQKEDHYFDSLIIHHLSALEVQPLIKYHKGKPVILKSDLAKLTDKCGGKIDEVLMRLKGKLVRGEDYIALQGSDFTKFKDCNKGKPFPPRVNSNTLIFQSGFWKILKALDFSCDIEFPPELEPTPLPQRNKIPVLSLKGCKKQCVDVPDNIKMQESIREISRRTQAFSELLRLYNRYNEPDEQKGFGRALESVISDIYCSVLSLRKIEYGVKEMYI
jgi:prophage antirepressor-like protein